MERTARDASTLEAKAPTAVVFAWPTTPGDHTVPDRDRRKVELDNQELDLGNAELDRRNLALKQRNRELVERLVRVEAELGLGSTR